MHYFEVIIDDDIYIYKITKSFYSHLIYQSMNDRAFNLMIKEISLKWKILFEIKFKIPTF